MLVIAVIPARFASSRFPGKPLVSILGKPMICWVADGVSRAQTLDQTIVTSDDERILTAAHSRGFHVEQSAEAHTCGSDRVWEIGARTDAEIIVNVQGDVPTIDGADVDACVQPLLDDEEIDVATLCRPIEMKEELADANMVKVVRNDAGNALYFSRAIIPHAEVPEAGLHFGHIGIYAYRREALKRFCERGPVQLERQEQLEQLRGLAIGLRYHVVEREFPSVDVNTPDDIPLVEQFLRRRMEEGK